MTYSDRAVEYAERATAGEVLACDYVRLACQRFLDDLNREGDDWPWVFDRELANQRCRFIEAMPHTKGRWAARGETTRLEDWQCFIETNVWGWVNGDGKRRFQIVYVEVPRKNGKSHLTAANGNLAFAADGEYGAEVYSGATNEKQAWEVFRPARLMAKRTDSFRSTFGVEINAKSMHIPADGSRFEPIIGKPGDGASPHMAIVDEYHEHDSDALVETMRTGMGAREQPILWIITTAGSDIEGACYRQRQDVVRLLEGTIRDDRTFGVIYTIDEGDDWKSDEALEKANPNLDVSVSREFLKQERLRAIQNSHKQAAFKTKHLNVWVSAGSPWMNMEWWNACADTSLTLEQFEGEAVWIGVDLASKIDIASVMLAFRRDEDVYLMGRHYIPESRMDEVDRYRGWVEDGHLTTTPGDIIDHETIQSELVRDAGRFRWVQAGFDAYNATQMIVHVNKELGRDDAAIDVPMTVAHLSEPMKWLEARTKAGTLHHDGNPAMNWMMSNVVARVDHNDNVFPRKERHENKIDGVVASIMALGCMIRSEERPQPGIIV